MAEKNIPPIAQCGVRIDASPLLVGFIIAGLISDDPT
jgi:hypothetical protein